MENNKTPKIRFKGFTDPWEQRKLGDLGSLKNGMNFSKDAMGHGYAFVNLQNIFGNNVVEVKSLGLAEASEKQLLEYSLQKGDVLFVRSSVKLEGVGEAALVAETLENTTYSGFIIRFRDEYGLNNDFKKFVFATKKVRDQIMSQATNSANKNISQSVLENLTFEIPSKDEQKQIGEYFSSLDNLITLHQRKYNKLLNVKKSMLEKMFPKNGSNIPEIRFKGFTDPWEQRKFGDVGSVAMCKRIFKEQTSDEGDVPFYKIGTFGGEPDAYISQELFDEYKAKYPFPNKGDILISASGSIGRTVEFTGENEYFQDSNIVWLKHGKDIDNSFLKILYNVVEWSCEGSTIKRLYNDNFLKTEFMLPNIDEQKKIGEYFCSLDNLITLHQRELDKLKIQKNLCWKKCFCKKNVNFDVMGSKNFKKSIFD